MKKIGLLLLSGLIVHIAQAQPINMDPDDIQGMMRKQLVVEHPDSTERVKPDVVVWPQENLGRIIKNVVDDIWDINQKVEYESQNEVKRGLDRGNPRYVYLFLTRHPDATVENDIWVLNYSRGEKVKEEKVDYQIFLPDIRNREVREYTEYDIRFTISIMQEHIKAIQKENKVVDFGDFLKMKADKACWKIKERHLLIDKGIIDKSLDARGMRRELRRVNHTLGGSKELNAILAENKDTCAFIIQYPGKFVTYTNSAFDKKYIFWYKIMIDAQNFEVIGLTGTGRNDNVLKPLDQADLDKMTECDVRKPKPKKEKPKKKNDRKKRR